MKTKFNEFLLEYVSNEKYNKFIFEQIINKLKLKYNVYNNIPIDRKFKNNIYLNYSISYDNSTYSYLYLYTEYDDLSEDVVDQTFNEYKNYITKILNKIKTNLYKFGVVLSYDIDFNSTRIYYKNIYNKRAFPPRYIYHTTNISNLNSILENGLELKSHKDSSDWSDYPEYAYPQAIFAANQNSIWDMTYKYDTVVFKIDTYKLKNTWFYDLNINDGNHYMTFESIPKECLTLVDQKTLKSFEN